MNDLQKDNLTVGSLFAGIGGFAATTERAASRSDAPMME